jgi:hypothetical protein
MDVVVLSLADRQLKPFAATPAEETMPAFSPDDRWIAYQSNEAGAMDVHVRRYPGPGGKWSISAGGGVQPHWTKGGRELVYLAGPTMNWFMAVEIAVEGDALRPGKPQLLFEMRVAQSEAMWYDVSADGSRFVVLEAGRRCAHARHVGLQFLRRSAAHIDWQIAVPRARCRLPADSRPITNRPSLTSRDMPRNPQRRIQ